MNLEDYKTLFVSITLIAILAASTPLIGMLIGMFLPQQEEPFLAMATLGEGGMADKYYPGGDPNIRVESPVRWYIYLYNHMGCAQYVAVRVKLLNSVLPGPDSASCSPSPTPAFFELRYVLIKNETRVSPLFWRVSEATQGENVVSITELVVNNMTVGLDATASDGYNFRMVLELWVYDDASDGLRFGWRSGQKYRCAWNQIWFNVTMPAVR